MNKIANVHWVKLAEAPGSRTEANDSQVVDSIGRAKSTLYRFLRYFFWYRRRQNLKRLDQLTAGWRE
jgi:hypothetical protein